MDESKAFLVKRLLHLGVGSVFVVASVWLIISGFIIEGFAIEYQIEGDTFSFNFTIVLDVVLLVVGLVNLSMALRLAKLPRNTIVNFPLTRLLAGTFLVLLSLTSAWYFGVSTGHGNPLGTWLFLGGLSLFFPTALVPMIVGFTLCVYCMFCFSKIHFERISSDPDLLTIVDIRTPRGKVAEIKVDEIESISLTNASTGPKYLWILVFIIPIVYLYIDGFSFLLNPSSFGNAFGTGIAYVISASVQLGCLLLLLLDSHHILKILAGDRIYEQQFTPANIKSWRRANIGFMLQPRSSRDEGSIKKQTSSTLPEPPVTRQPTDYKRVTIGILFIVLGMLSRIFHAWAGEMLRFMLFIAGIILIVEGIKMDLRGFGRQIDSTHVPEGMIYSMRKGVYKSELMIPHTIEPASIQQLVQPRKLALVDHVVITGLAFFLGFQLYPVIVLLGPETGIGASLATWNILAIFGIGALLFLIHVDPRSVLKFKHGDRNDQIVHARRSRRQYNPIWLFRNFLAKYKIAFNQHGKSVIARILEYWVSVVLGMVASAIVYLG
ncbi:hypothetical protein GF325_15540 [Candidatus Bathyarchaeota archaeon]|nr:hypothetical protein [Candidatus Bathyarchaeota archaeon]